MTNHITPKQLAIELDTDPKTIRKFLRSITDDRAGKGGRWAIDESLIPELRIRFAEFTARRATIFTLDSDD